MSLAQLVETMHNICKVRGPGHQKKNPNWEGKPILCAQQVSQRKLFTTKQRLKICIVPIRMNIRN